MYSIWGWLRSYIPGVLGDPASQTRLITLHWCLEIARVHSLYTSSPNPW